MNGNVAFLICLTIIGSLLFWLDAPLWSYFAVMGALLGVRLFGYMEGENDALKADEKGIVDYRKKSTTLYLSVVEFRFQNSRSFSAHFSEG